MTASEVVRNTPTYTSGRFIEEAFNKQIVKPVSVSAVQFFCLLETARKHSQQGHVPCVENKRVSRFSQLFEKIIISSKIFDINTSMPSSMRSSAV